LDDLSDEELRYLMEAAISVLWEQAQHPVVQSPTQLPPRALATELRHLLGDETGVDRVVQDAQVSHDVGMAVLREIGQQPEVAAEVEAAYQARRDMLAVDAGLVLGAALLLAVLKLKQVKVGKRGGVDVQFHEVQTGVLDGIRRLLGA
jgi:hypothetical protein